MKCVFDPRDLHRPKGKTCHKCGAYIGDGLFPLCGRCDIDVFNEVNSTIKQIEETRNKKARFMIVETQ